MSGRGEREAGFTIVEVVVAIFVLVMAALATFGLLSAATKNTVRAKGTQVAMDQAQQEMEALRSLSYEKLALTYTPGHSEHPLNPDYRVSGSEFALTREASSPKAKMVVDGGEVYGEPAKTIEGGVVVPSEEFKSGDVSGTIHRYVVWRNDKGCKKESEEICRQAYKQIIVAVKLNTAGDLSGERGYVEVQSDFVNPVKSPLNDPVPGEHGVVTAQQLYLSDTPCSKTPPTERQPITKDHPLHDTLGTCASGVQEGSETPGAPDVLLLSAPPMPSGEEPSLYNYSDNLALNPAPEADKGVQIVKSEKDGCDNPPKGAHPAEEIHRWVTDPMTSPFVMSGTKAENSKVTIEFYTRTLNDAEDIKGKLCIFLFKREETTGSTPVATDTMLTHTELGTTYPYWTYIPENNNWWPSKAWVHELKTMYFSGAPYTIPAGARLGVAISVDREGTSSEVDAIPIMYDHPSYPSRIEVDTNTPIEGG